MWYIERNCSSSFHRKTCIDFGMDVGKMPLIHNQCEHNVPTTIVIGKHLGAFVDISGYCEEHGIDR